MEGGGQGQGRKRNEKEMRRETRDDRSARRRVLSNTVTAPKPIGKLSSIFS